MRLHHNLKTVLSCARPIYFRSDFPGHELFGKGTCFIVKASGAIWLATAAHCLANGMLDDLAVPRFLPGPGRAPIGDFFQPIALAGPVPEDEDDTAGFDVVMIRTNEIDHPDALDLEDEAFLAPLEHARRGDPVRITGFPGSLANGIDRREIAVQAFHTDGQYGSPTSSKHLHQFTIDLVGKVTDLDGMSGGPLFYVRAGRYFFAGVVVRGSAESKNAHFVDGRWLPVLAERLTDEMRRSHGSLVEVGWP